MLLSLYVDLTAPPENAAEMTVSGRISIAFVIVVADNFDMPPKSEPEKEKTIRKVLDGTAAKA